MEEGLFWARTNPEDGAMRQPRRSGGKAPRARRSRASQAPSGIGQTATGTAPYGRYQEIIDILDDAVGGSAASIGAHGPFWRGKTRDQFVAALVFGQKLLVVGDGAGSNIIKALSAQAPFGADVGTPGAAFRRMPAGRPPVPDEKIAAIKKWIDANCPE
jgi:hypothetical protein